jgi:hypothetical protein
MPLLLDDPAVVVVGPVVVVVALVEVALVEVVLVCADADADAPVTATPRNRSAASPRVVNREICIRSSSTTGTPAEGQT